MINTHMPKYVGDICIMRYKLEFLYAILVVWIPIIPIMLNKAKRKTLIEQLRYIDMVRKQKISLFMRKSNLIYKDNGIYENGDNLLLWDKIMNEDEEKARIGNIQYDNFLRVRGRAAFFAMEGGVAQAIAFIYENAVKKSKNEGKYSLKKYFEDELELAFNDAEKTRNDI